MRHLPLYSLLALCAFVSCERRNSAARAPEPSPSPTSSVPVESIVAPSTQPSQATNHFAEVAQSIRPAVIIVSVFDETGHLSANGHGFFISGDGKFIADRSVIAGGVNAVAKAADGAIYNVSGALAQTPTQNLVLLKLTRHGRHRFLRRVRRPCQISAVLSRLFSVRSNAQTP